MRSYRDLWLWLGGLFLVLIPFPAAIAIAYYAKLTHYSVLLNWWMFASLIFFLAAFACFLGAIRGLRFPPWKKVKFPDIKVDIYGDSTLTTDEVVSIRGASSDLVIPQTLKVYRVRIVNMEEQQNASVTARLYVKIVPGTFGDALEMICPPPDWTLSPTLNLDPIQRPAVLQPGTSVGGDLPYVLTRYLKFASPFSAALELEDHVTNKRVRIPAQLGKFDKRTMTPSSGGITISQEPIVPQDIGPPVTDLTSPTGPAETPEGAEAHGPDKATEPYREPTERQIGSREAESASEADPPAS